MDGETHDIGKWDMMIAHPPCTYMSAAGACRMYPRKGEIDADRFQKAQDAKQFFNMLRNAGIPRIAIENPVPLKVVGLPEPTQIIQPYQFGEPYSKKTCLWLKGLPNLNPTNVVKPIGSWVCGNAEVWKKEAARGGVIGKSKSAKHRSKTFWGIARAMAEQWGLKEET